MTPDISEIEKVPGGLLISFEDGRSAIYSTALLYDLLPNVQPKTQFVFDDLKGWRRCR
jgi:hypothetical protein